MITGIILGFVLTQLSTPTIVWVAYGVWWVLWIIRSVFNLVKTIQEV